MGVELNVGKTNRILIIVENLPVPFDRRVWMEATTLKEAGYEVSVICPQGKGYTEPYEELDGIRIYRYPSPPPTRSKLSYAWEFPYCWFQSLKLAMRAWREGGFDAIHACNPPDTIFIIHLRFSPEVFKWSMGFAGEGGSIRRRKQ